MRIKPNIVRKFIFGISAFLLLITWITIFVFRITNDDYMLNEVVTLFGAIVTGIVICFLFKKYRDIQN